MLFRTVQVEKVPPSFQHEQRGYQTQSSRRHSDVGETACRRPAGKGSHEVDTPESHPVQSFFSCSWSCSMSSLRLLCGCGMEKKQKRP